MIAPLSESASAQDPSADKSDTAQTVRQSVMAEQVSHNVVNVPESASGSSPLVDVVANHKSTAASEGGNPTPFTTKSTSFNKPQDRSSTDNNAPDGRKIDVGHAATEPSAGDAVAKPDNVPAISPPSDADQGPPTTNGVHDATSQGSVIEDGGSQDVSAVNSDTEMSKGEEMKDGHLHVRTNSVKKPATFSKISVTKNFLAKSASTAPVAAKTGEKGMVVPPCVHEHN